VVEKIRKKVSRAIASLFEKYVVRREIEQLELHVFNKRGDNNGKSQ